MDSRQYETIFNNIDTNIVVYCTKLSVLSDIVSIVPYCLQYCNGLVCRCRGPAHWQSTGYDSDARSDDPGPAGAAEVAY